MSNDKRQPREKHPLHEGSSEEKFREEEPPGIENVSEPVEKEGPEDPEVVIQEGADGELASSVEGPVEEPVEEAPHEGGVPSEESPEITPDEIDAMSLEELAEELEATRKERDEYLDGMLRMKAELENARKRQEKDRERLSYLAAERLVRELLPVLDNLERALEVEGDIREGVRATLEQLVAVLGREGLTTVFSDGENFDPAVHEAVMSQPSEEHEEDTIVQTLERGYLLNGKPIRPAKVIVAR